MLLAAVGALPVGDEQRLGLIALRRLDQRAWLRAVRGSREMPRSDRCGPADSRPTSSKPRARPRRARPGAVLVHHAIERRRQAADSPPPSATARHRRASSARRDRFARQRRPPCHRRRTDGPSLCRRAASGACPSARLRAPSSPDRRDLRSAPVSQLIVQRAERDLRPVADLRARVVRAGKHEIDEPPVVRRSRPSCAMRAESRDGVGQRLVGRGSKSLALRAARRSPGTAATARAARTPW